MSLINKDYYFSGMFFPVLFFANPFPAWLTVFSGMFSVSFPNRVEAGAIPAAYPEGTFQIYPGLGMAVW